MTDYIIYMWHFINGLSSIQRRWPVSTSPQNILRIQSHVVYRKINNTPRHYLFTRWKHYSRQREDKNHRNSFDVIIIAWFSWFLKHLLTHLRVIFILKKLNKNSSWSLEYNSLFSLKKTLHSSFIKTVVLYFKCNFIFFHFSLFYSY